MIEFLQTCLMKACLGALLALAAVAVVACEPYFMASVKRIFARFGLAVLAVGLVFYGGSKSITFPRTDPDVAYFQDNGSYVTNDYVHVAFKRLIVPVSAPLFLDRRVNGSTDDNAWENMLATTIEDAGTAFDFASPAATNYDWICYTTWTPGPTVRTNGVWHANWGIDRKYKAYVIPVKTCIRLNGDVIATPKSKEKENEE